MGREEDIIKFVMIAMDTRSGAVPVQVVTPPPNYLDAMHGLVAIITTTTTTTIFDWIVR